MIETGWFPDPEASELWPFILSALEKAARRGNSEAWAENDLLWTAQENSVIVGLATTRLLTDGRAELMHIAGTRFNEWYRQLEAKICAWARDAGAKVMIARGRKGWIRPVSKIEWRVTGKEDGLMLYEKVL